MLSGGLFSGTPMTADEGVIAVQLNANDPYQGTASDVFSITAYDNAPQVNQTIPTQNATLTNPFSLVIPPFTFVDPDGDELVLTAGTLPPWLSFNQTTGIFSGTPPVALGVGSTSAQLIATDPFGKSTNEVFSIDVTSSPPVVSYLPSHLQATPNSAFFFPVNTVFAIENGFLLTYSVSGLPSSGWVTFQNNILVGTPASTDVGSTTFTLIATDQFGATQSVEIPLVVSVGGSNSLAVNSPILDLSKPAGVPFTYLIPTKAFVDAPGRTISLISSLGDGSPLPDWFSFDGNQTYTGSPQASNVGFYNILVRAFDQLGATAIQTFSLVITAPFNLPPEILSPPSGLVAFTMQLFNQYVGNVFAAPVTLSASFTPNTWLKLEKNYLTGTPKYTDSAVVVVLNGKSPSGAISSVTFKVDLQGDTALTLSFKIIGPVLTAFGTLAGMYRKRALIKEKLSATWLAMRRIRTPGITIDASSEILMKPTDSAITLKAYVGMPFYQSIDLNANPLLKGAQKYAVLGETRSVQGMTTNRLPDWVTGVNVNMGAGTIVLEGTPEESSVGLNKINIVAYHGGQPSYYKVFVEVEIHGTSIDKRTSMFQIPQDGEV